MTNAESLPAAGRDLDALVAEHVMGGSEYESDTSTWRIAGLYRPLPQYSTDITAAWEVVAYLQSKHFQVRITGYHSDEWFCDVNHFLQNPGDPENTVGEGATAPHAVCLAAIAVDLKG